MPRDFVVSLYRWQSRYTNWLVVSSSLLQFNDQPQLQLRRKLYSRILIAHLAAATTCSVWGSPRHCLCSSESVFHHSSLQALCQSHPKCACNSGKETRYLRNGDMSFQSSCYVHSQTERCIRCWPQFTLMLSPSILCFNLFTFSHWVPCYWRRGFRAYPVTRCLLWYESHAFTLTVLFLPRKEWDSSLGTSNQWRNL